MTKEEFEKKIKVISDGAWGHGNNTTVNSLVEFIIREALWELVLPRLDALENKEEELKNGAGRRVSQPKGTTAT